MKVHYFDAYARGDQIRMLLTHAKQPFEDVRYSFENWPDVKATGIFEFGQVPAFEENGFIYT